LPEAEPILRPNPVVDQRSGSIYGDYHLGPAAERRANSGESCFVSGSGWNAGENTIRAEITNLEGMFGWRTVVQTGIADFTNE